jgi:hypothetical protein
METGSTGYIGGVRHWSADPPAALVDYSGLGGLASSSVRDGEAIPEAVGKTRFKVQGNPPPLASRLGESQVGNGAPSQLLPTRKPRTLEPAGSEKQR